MVFFRSRSVARRLVALALASCLVLHGAVLAQDAPPSERKCELTVSPGDTEKGLAVVSDARCVNGGEGCINAICRHCKNAAATEFPTYPSCGDYDEGGEHSSDLTGTDDDNAEGSGEGSGDGSGDDGNDMPDSLGANASVSGGSYGCPYPTSGGDFDAGIQLVGDGSCSKGGLGCFAGVCRFCKFRDSNKSNHLVTCDSLGYTIRTPVLVAVLPPPNPDTGCPFNISSGDFDVGVQLVGDLTCAGGGLGCYKDVCRFCKFQETPQSSHWLSCGELGYPRTPEPTFATASFDDDFGEGNGDTGGWDGSTGCAYAVSSGDFAVGVQLVRDASCAAGGLGCFANTCRFCQFRPTLQSSHLLTCAQLGWTPHSPPQQPIGTPQDIGPIADPVTGCPFSVSSGDFAVGVQLVGDPSCETGGLGCFKDVCRFCKFRETPQSTNWVPCANYNYPPIAPPVIQPADVNEPAVDYATNCPYPVSEGDYAAGVQLVGDATCDKGGLGCFQDVCRFCKFQETPQSTDYVSCDSLGWPRNVVPVERPVKNPTIDPATECPYPVSTGDFAAGIQLVGDADCVKGGLGCYKNVCRFCQFQETPQSKPYVHCSELGYPRNGATFAPASVDANTDTGCSFPVSSGDYDAGVQLVGDISCDKGGVGCFQDVCRFCKFRSTPQSAAFVNCEDLGYFFGSNADAFVPAPTSTGPSTKCPFTTSVGDLAAGILLVGDETCEKGGLGCYQNACRYCQFVPTEKSNQYVTCASLGYNYALPPMPTMPAPTPAPLPTTALPPPTPTLAPTLSPCPIAAVSQGDFAVGVDLVGDTSCAQGGLGCYQGVCRYCKFKETPQAAGWLPCASFTVQPIAAPADIVDTPPPATPAPTTPAPIVAQVCDRPVSPGDKIAGVGFATDYSCLIAGLGCMKGTVCRLCKVFRSDKSNHLEPCSAYNGATPTIIVVQPSAAFDPAACTATLSVGDTEGGVSAVFDQSCSAAGASVGCFGGVCRYCQVFASEKSKDFLPCPPQAASASQPTTLGLGQAASAVSSFRAAAREQAAGFAASLAQIDELFKDRTFQMSLMGAACVGIIAVVALVVLGAKRAIARRQTRSTGAEDEDSDMEESEKLKQGDAPPTPV